jgi:(p)ppGpp synthase/HD superfamily hydrolase
MSNLEQAITIAVTAHRGQRDKAGQPYILHPLRVMQHCATDEERIVAVLHDVLEDTEVTASDLRREGFDEDIIEALACLTKVQDEAYDAFISRVMTNPLARRVKVNDLLDNMDCTRLPVFGEGDAARMKRYVQALARLRAGETIER